MGNYILRNKDVLGVSILASVTIIAGVILNSINVGATSTSAQATVNVEEACTMNSTITTPHTATIPNGTYQADIGTTTINVICNDSQGYAIYAVGYTGDEIGGENSTKLVNATGNTNTIATGTATSGNTSNWAMKISTSGSSFVGTIDNSFGNYHAVPNEYTKVAHYNSATDAGNNATGSTYQTTYAAFVSSTQLAGNYAGKVKYTMVHPANETPTQPVACEAGKICYNANTNIIEGQMGKQSASNNASVTLYAPNFKRDGYGFAGWSDAYDYETNSNANFYGPQETITTPSDISTNGLSLYAVWIKPERKTMQQWTTDCYYMHVGQITALTDERDGNTYAVAKLADGKCWMIENLRLDDASILSNSNTNVPSLPLTNTYDSNTTSNHLSPTSSVAYNASNAPEGWCITESSACNDQSRLRTDNTALFTNNTSSSYSILNNVYSYGNYYNWYSATVGYGKYGSSYSEGYHAPGDICPAGWHLPISSDKTNEAYNEFWQLIVTSINNGINPANYDSSAHPSYSGDEAIPVSNALRAYPNNYVYSGNVNGPYILNRSSSGGYWSASGYGSSGLGAYIMYLNDTSVVPNTGFSSKYNGLTVRCIYSEAL